VVSEGDGPLPANSIGSSRFKSSNGSKRFELLERLEPNSSH
jgi:hypothetical protein